MVRLRHRLEVGSRACGCTVGDDRSIHSIDRYAIRTRNLQDWNLTRYRCANRSKAPRQGRRRGTSGARPWARRLRRRLEDTVGRSRHAVGRPRSRQFLLAGHRLGLGGRDVAADCKMTLTVRARLRSAPARRQALRASRHGVRAARVAVGVPDARSQRALEYEIQALTRFFEAPRPLRAVSGVERHRRKPT